MGSSAGTPIAYLPQSPPRSGGGKKSKVDATARRPGCAGGRAVADRTRLARYVKFGGRYTPIYKENVMGLLSLAIIFFIIALVAYVLGARGLAGMSAGIGRTLLFVFLVLAIIFLILGLVGRPA